MGSLAGMLQASGHRVTGSDVNVYPPMSTMLESLGITVRQGYSAENLSPTPDCVVVGNAIPRGNPEVEEALNRKLLYRSQPEVVKEEFIRGRRSLVISGTHGKTTTTSITNSPYFLIEGDEYDTAWFDKGPKFMHYLPELAIVNNVEFDHADIYRDLDAVKLAFRRFINTVPGNGRLIAGWDNVHVREIIAEMGNRLFTRVETFGTSDGAAWQARDLDFSGQLSRFKVFREGVEWAEFETPLIGEFNIRNCLSVIIAAEAWGVEVAAIKEALATFQSVKRRMQVRGFVRDVTVIDDFAHHPTAVKETLQALKTKYKDRRLVAVFEPRSWSSRLAVFQEPYAQSFEAADFVIIASVFDSRTATEKGDVLNTRKLIDDIDAQGKPAFAIDAVDDIVAKLDAELRPGDVVAIMSNGGFGGIHEKLLNALGNNTHASLAADS